MITSQYCHEKAIAECVHLYYNDKTIKTYELTRNKGGYIMRRRLLSFNKLVQQNISEILNEKSTLQALEIKLDQRYTDKSKASEKQKSLFR